VSNRVPKEFAMHVGSVVIDGNDLAAMSVTGRLPLEP
jgi:hypothetical protein